MKMIDHDFSIQDFVQGCPLQSWLSVVLKVLGNESQNTLDLKEKFTLEIHFEKL